MREKLNILLPLWRAVESLLFQAGSVTRKSPFIRSKIDLKDFMGAVVLVLLFFAVIPAIYFFGAVPVISRIVVSFICGVFIIDVGWAIIFKEKTINEGAIVTCLFIPLIFPPSAPYWAIGLASAIAILIRNVFGGIGKNIWNPALIGRLIVSLSFADTVVLGYKKNFWGIPDVKTFFHGLDAISGATPLTIYKVNHALTSYQDLLLGDNFGSMGETFRIGLLIGGLILCRMKIVNWRIPLSYLGSVFVFTLILYLNGAANVPPPLFQILGGGLIFGAFYMATDPVSAPASNLGRWIFGTACGLLTVFLRAYTPFPEGVMIAILLMNTLKTPIDWLINQWILRKNKGKY